MIGNLKNIFSKLTGDELLSAKILAAQELVAKEKLIAQELLAKNKSEAEKVISDESVSHSLIIAKLDKLHRQHVEKVVIILILLLLTGVIGFIVMIRTPKIKKIEDISTSNAEILKGINDLFTIAEINKINDSIRDINYQHLPKFLPIPAENITRVSSIFGDWRGTRRHLGTDYSAPSGTPVYASASGIVIVAKYDKGYGNMIEVDNRNHVRERYGHLSLMYVKEGQDVKQGELIGAVGNTGNSSGDHLHFEIIINYTGIDKNIDPAEFIFL